MNNTEIKAFIKKHNHLFWYIPKDKKEDISKDILVEFTLNYGSLEDIKHLIDIMGIAGMAQVFYNAKGRKKMNYYPEIYNFFDMFFSKYA